MKLIADWRHSWRLWSVRVLAFGAAFYAFLLAAPDQVLAVWNSLPAEVQAVIPNAREVSLFLFAAAAIARIMRQGSAAADGGIAPSLQLLASPPPPAWRAATASPVARAITALVVHCSATPAGKPFFAADIRRWHKKQGWSDIGYHFVVDLDGAIEVGRPLKQVGAHVAGHNATTIGICYIGGVAADGRTPADTRTHAQKVALAMLLGELRHRWPAAEILGHRDFPKVAKACPSFDARAEYKELGR